MGYIIGVGSYWQFLVLDENLDYFGAKATQVWQSDWGCIGTPPVEKDLGPEFEGMDNDIEWTALDYIFSNFALYYPCALPPRSILG